MNKPLKLYSALLGMICFELLSLLPMLLATVGLTGKMLAPNCSHLLSFIAKQLTTFEFLSLGLLGAILLTMVQLLKSLHIGLNSVE